MPYGERSVHICPSSLQELLQPAASLPHPQDREIVKPNRVSHPNHHYNIMQWLWQEVNNEG